MYKIVTGEDAFNQSIEGLARIMSGMLSTVMTDLATKEMLKQDKQALAYFVWTLPDGTTMTTTEDVIKYFATAYFEEMGEAVFEHNALEFFTDFIAELGKLKCEFIREKEQVVFNV